ncbi:hypothetical protein I4F81_005365 [Pyropia yezoensis]|uniref:Uncharacterized protein n=1 Tax=Pyropia yezoensis TaxID=2788 RepID=A0ACC3BYW0_PYRYE|nr:hypothetical protein I4F81_005365 [Neopyropia yezoensis]
MGWGGRQWLRRRVGPVINAAWSGDWYLKAAHGLGGLEWRVAGVEGVRGVTNVDAGRHGVTGHMAYRGVAGCLAAAVLYGGEGGVGAPLGTVNEGTGEEGAPSLPAVDHLSIKDAAAGGEPPRPVAA